MPRSHQPEGKLAAACRVRWLECWVEPCSERLRLLVLCGLADGTCEVRDPEGQVVERFSTYDEADLWLVDEEFSFVEGRVELGD